MRKSARSICTISMGFAAVLVCSCETPLLEQEKCVSDGVNIYVQCFGGRQKVFGLRYRTFYVMQNGVVPKAAAFCGDHPEQVTIFLRNT